VAASPRLEEAVDLGSRFAVIGVDRGSAAAL